MGDLVNPTIKLINACINKYTDFCAFKEECATFRQSLCNVKEVLEDVQRELSDGTGSAANTRLRRPMELLQAATNEGGEVLRKCSAKHKLLAFVFSRQLMGMLNKAKADIEEAMRLLQVSSVRIQVSTRRVMDCVSDRLDELHKQINASYTSKHEVADLIRAEMQQHRESHGASIAMALSDVLVKMGVVSSAQDCADQLAELQREADSIRKAKVIYDEEMLEAVKALTAQQDGDAAALPGLEPSQRQGSETSSAVQECMVCPISGDIMRDPVTVVESGLTYDRKSLCTSLLMYPDLEPGTGQRFDCPLHYTPSIALRNMITAQYGDSCYQKYDDAEFKVQYETKWKELACPPPSVVSFKDQGRTGSGSSTSVDAESVLTDPTSAPTLHSDGSGSGCNPSDFGGSGAAGGEPSPAARSPEADGPGVKFGDSEDTDRVDTMSSDAGSDGEEVAEHGDATPLGGKYRACWRSRRARWLVVAAVLVVLGVIVWIVVGATKRGPSSASSATSSSGLRPSASPTVSLASSPTSQPTPSPTISPAERFTSTLPPYTTDSLRNTSSPQYRAYELVTKLDQVPEGDEEMWLFRMTQRFALATLFYSLGLDGWIKPFDTECEWGDTTSGSNITCNADSEVVVLDPDNAGDVPSPIPREIGLLTSLVSLDLGLNSLTSSIPTELGRLANLTVLCLDDNALTSSIPTELGRLSALTSLDLSDNSLKSSIPTELSQLSNLTDLSLDSNSLTSSIPTELGRLSALTSLELDWNFLASSIPTELAGLSTLTYLSLDSNSLTSSIPTELGRLSALRVLSLSSNSLISSIPTELGRLFDLTSLDLGPNSLTSSIPTELGRLSDLRFLDLRSNSLTSTFPTALGWLTNLTSLDLSSNSLNSSIPTELGRLTALTDLDLGSNSLASSIPTELGLLSNLEELGLFANLLTGTIPSALCSVDGIEISIDCEEVTCSCCRCNST